MAGRRGTGAVLAAAALIALVAVFFIGRATAGGGQATSPTAPGVTGAAEPGPTRTANGVPVGYAHTREGAVAAAVNYDLVLGSPLFLNDARRNAAMRILGTPSYVRGAIPALAAAVRALRQGPLGQGLRRGSPTLYQGAPLGYRVVSFSPDRAVVEVWGLSLLGNTTTIQPQISFHTGTATLLWQRGDWKLDTNASQPGPTLAAAPNTQPSPAEQTVTFARRLRELHYAP